MIHRTLGIRAFVDDARPALERAESLGIDWRKTRFGRYVRALDDAASYFAEPRRLYPDEPDKQALLFEASSQLAQLAAGYTSVAAADASALLPRMKKIFSGSELANANADPSRDTLFELAAAASLEDLTFQVTLPEDGKEDLRADFPTLPTFVVECKRPMHSGTLESNLKKLFYQLRERRRLEREQPNGMAIIGIDRMSALADTPHEVANRAALEYGVNVAIRHERDRIVIDREYERLFPHIAVVGIVFVGALFVRDPGVLHTVSTLGFFWLGEPSHPIRRNIARAFEGRIPTMPRSGDRG